MPTIAEACDAEASLARFHRVMESDAASFVFEGQEHLRSWMFVERRLKIEDSLAPMNFYGFDGGPHLVKFMNWFSGYPLVNYLPAEKVQPLFSLSLERDRQCAERLKQTVPAQALENAARYNSQDFVLQRLYPVPERQVVHRILDFGGGFGRQANLAFAAAETELMTVVEAVPASYLTQRAYYTGLGLRVADYIDVVDAGRGFDLAELAPSHDIIHLPTWRMDLLPSHWFDMVCCVQVLKELQLETVFYALRHFARILKPGGALYIRDNPQFHNPNGMPMPEDMLVEPFGFTLEFRPHLRDFRDLWGLPRIWRKPDLETFLGPVG